MGAMLPSVTMSQVQKAGKRKSEPAVMSDFRFFVAAFTKIDGFTGQSLPESAFNPHEIGGITTHFFSFIRVFVNSRPSLMHIVAQWEVILIPKHCVKTE